MEKENENNDISFSQAVHRMESNFKKRYATLAKIYEERLSSCMHQVPVWAKERMGLDEALQTMLSDPHTLFYLPSRMEEIIHESIIDQRESYIQTLAATISTLEYSHITLEQDHERCQHRERQHQQNLHGKDAELRKTVEHLAHITRERNDVRGQVTDLMLQLTTSTTQVKELQGQVVHLTSVQSTGVHSSQQERNEWQEALRTMQTERDNALNSIKVLQTERDLLTEASVREASKSHSARRKQRALQKAQVQEGVNEGSLKEAMQRQMSWAEREVERMRMEVDRVEVLNAECNAKYEAMGKQVEALLEEEAEENQSTILRLKARGKSVAVQMEKERQEYESQLRAARSKVEALQGDRTTNRSQLVERESTIADFKVEVTQLKMQCSREVARLEKELTHLLHSTSEELEMEKVTHDELRHALHSQREMYETKLETMESSRFHREKNAAAHHKSPHKAWVEPTVNDLHALQARYEEMLKSQQMEMEKSQNKSMVQMETLRKEALVQAQSQSGVETSDLFQTLLTSRSAEQALVLKSTHMPLMEHHAIIQKTTDDVTISLKKEFEVELERELRAFDEGKAVEYKAAMVNVRTGIQKIENQLRQEKTLRKTLQEDVASRELKKKNLEKDMEALQSTKEQLLEQLEQADTNLTRLTTIVRDGETQRSEVDLSKEKLVAMQVDLEQGQLELSSTRTELEHLQTALDDQRTILEAAHETTRAQEEAHVMALETLTTQITEKQGNNTSEIAKAEEARAGLEERIAMQSQDAEAQHAEHVKQLDARICQVEEAKKQEFEWKTKTEACHETILTLEADVKRLTSEENERCQTAQQEEKGRTFLQEKNEALSHQIKELKTQLQTLKSEVQDLTGALAVEFQQKCTELENKLQVMLCKERTTFQEQLELQQKKSMIEKQQDVNQVRQLKEEIKVEKATWELQLQQAMKLRSDASSTKEGMHLVNSYDEKMETLQLEMDSHQRTHRSETHQMYDQLECVITFYTQLLQGVTNTDVLPISDRQLFVEMRQFWMKRGKNTSNDNVPHDYKIRFQEAVAQAKSTLEKRLREPMESARKDHDIGMKHLAASKKKVHALETEIQEANIKLSTLTLQNTALAHASEADFNEKQAEIQRITRQLKECRARSEEDSSEVLRKTKQVQEEVAKTARRELTRLREEQEAALEDVEGRLRTERTKLKEVQSKLLDTAHEYEQTLQVAKNQEVRLNSQLEITKEDLTSATEHLKQVQAVNRKLLVDLEQRTSIPAPNIHPLDEDLLEDNVGRTRQAVRPMKMSQLSTMLERSLEEMETDGISCASTLGASAEALKNRMRQQNDRFHAKVYKAKTMVTRQK